MRTPGREPLTHWVLEDVARQTGRILVAAYHVFEEVGLPRQLLAGLVPGLAGGPALEVTYPAGEGFALLQERQQNVDVVRHHAKGQNLDRPTVAEAEGVHHDPGYHWLGEIGIPVQTPKPAMKDRAGLIVRVATQTYRTAWMQHAAIVATRERGGKGAHGVRAPRSVVLLVGLARRAGAARIP